MKEEKEKLFIQMAITQWKISNEKINTVFETISSKQYASPIAPGANSAAWILAHLAGANDNLFPLLTLGDLRFPMINGMAKSNHSPHNEIEKDELKACWLSINSSLLHEFNRMQPEEWFDRHNSISPEDFIKEPHRNKLNVLLSRTNHQAHHAGQLALIK
jgi:hypothetical protein